MDNMVADMEDKMEDRKGCLIEEEGSVVRLLKQFAQISSLATVISIQETFSEKCTFNLGKMLLSE